MVRYKRGRRYRNSTNVVKMKFQSFMDISTNENSMQIITVSAGGRDLLMRLGPQFSAYKYYKIGNIAVKLVPASTLPVSPSGLSYDADEPGVDPRDQLTPGLMRITNGEDVFENLTGMSDGVQHAIYNNMLLDPRWFKWMLQSGVKRHAIPRYWQIGQLHQDKWPGAIQNLPYINSDGLGIADTVAAVHSVRDSTGNVEGVRYGSSPYGLFQTGHRGVLGWLPTDELAHVYNNTGTPDSISALDVPLIASPPEVEVMKIILPKAYKTRYYYRMFITETVYFREPIMNFGITYDNTDFSYRPLDVFHIMQGPLPITPNSPIAGRNIATDAQTGGNYGNDKGI